VVADGQDTLFNGDAPVPSAHMPAVPGIDRRGFLRLAGGASAAVLLAACGGSAGQGGATSGASAATSERRAATSGRLRIDQYGDPMQDTFIEVVAQPFAEERGIELEIGSYGIQTEMLANVRANPGTYDVVRCSDFAIWDGIKEGLLEPIDLANVPNYENIDDAYANPVADAGPEHHTVAFAPQCYVLVRALDEISQEYEDDSILYAPRYEGKISLRDFGGYRILQTALHLGYDFNNLSEAQETEVFATLREQRALVEQYWQNEAEIRALIANKEVWAADYWLHNIALQAEELGVAGWIPANGSPGWLEGLSIAKGSPNKQTAEELLNYFLQPDVFMEFARKAAVIPTLKQDLWDLEEHQDAVPGLAPFMEIVIDRSVPLDLEVWDAKKTAWSEEWEAIKLGV
jgi:spermidine/putrescine transport system substrate-binding protein